MGTLAPSDPRQVGPYTLVARLGSGGMGCVYLGFSPAAERVAVKIIKPEGLPDRAMRQRFAGEVDNIRMVFGSWVARFEDADLESDPPWPRGRVRSRLDAGAVCRAARSVGASAGSPSRRNPV
jgi:eukaryotic-like serine/threonine-protein kinase